MSQEQNSQKPQEEASHQILQSPPVPTPVTPPVEDVTAYHPGQENWSIHNLPDILYVLRPTEEHAKSKARVPNTPYLIFGKYVRDFPMLPRQISSRVEAWRMEAWWRMDRRLQPQDIADRVHPKFYFSASGTEHMRYMFRANFNIASWTSGSSMAAVARELKRNGIDPARNSTRGLTPGLIDPEKGEAGGRVPPPSFWRNYADPSEWDSPSPPRQPKQKPVSAKRPALPALPSSAAPAPPSSLRDVFAACAQQPSKSSLPQSSLLTSFQASTTKRRLSGTSLPTPTKKRKTTLGELTEHRVQKTSEEHEGNGGQATTGPMRYVSW